MKTHWFFLAMLTVLLCVCATSARVDAALLDMPASTALNEDGETAGPSEAFPAAPSVLSEEGEDSSDSGAAE